MPFDNAPFMNSTGCAVRDRSRAGADAETLAAWIAGPTERKRVQRERDRGADLVRVEVRVPRAMAPAIRFLAAVLRGDLAGPGLSHDRRAGLRLRALRMLAILGSDGAPVPPCPDWLRADKREGAVSCD